MPSDHEIAFLVLGGRRLHGRDQSTFTIGAGAMPRQCQHLDQVRNVQPRTPGGCEECLASGDRWVHLRLCQECGHVGCCDQSPNRHATKHFHASQHPIMRSFEPGEDWSWCYVGELFIEPAVTARN
jgi:hypothetical protein